MPRLKTNRSPYEGYIGLVLARRRADGMTLEDLASACGVSPQTLRRRLAEPETISLGLVRKINRALGILAEDARAALPMW